MKRNDIKALAEKSTAELEKMLVDLKLQLAKARLEKSAGKLANTSLTKTLADDVARIKTKIGEKNKETQKQ
jgi:ribosomal protein L29